MEIAKYYMIQAMQTRLKVLELAKLTIHAYGFSMVA